MKRPEEVVFLNTQELSLRWKIHVETARRWLRDGYLPSHLLRRRRLVALNDVLAAEAAGRIEKRTD